MFGQFKTLIVFALVVFITQANAGDGKTKAAVCGACHGVDGNSVNPEWPSLAGQHASYISAQLRAFQSGDRKNPNMDAMVINLTAMDIDDIATYYAAQQPKISPITIDKIAAGEKIYRGGNKETGVPACMACHGPNGAGNPAARYPALRGQHAKYTSIQLVAYRSGERTTDAKSMMRNVASRLSDAEIDALAEYISALH